jgi:hypothetical protein
VITQAGKITFKTHIHHQPPDVQAGAGLDIWRLVVDVRFEGNLTRLGDHMYFAGEKVTFSQRPTRWLLSVGYAF